MAAKLAMLLVQAIADFQGLVVNIHKCSKSIEKSIAAIASAKLCPKLTLDKTLPTEFSHVCEQIMQHQKKVCLLSYSCSLSCCGSRKYCLLVFGP